MENKVEINERWPKATFWMAKVKLTSEDENGKKKTTREVHLVDALTVTEVATKVKAMMQDESMDWTIQSISKANVSVVY